MELSRLKQFSKLWNSGFAACFLQNLWIFAPLRATKLRVLWIFVPGGLLSAELYIFLWFITYWRILSQNHVDRKTKTHFEARGRYWKNNGPKVMSKIVFGCVGPLESTKKHFQEMAHTNFSSRVEWEWFWRVFLLNLTGSITRIWSGPKNSVLTEELKNVKNVFWS